MNLQQSSSSAFLTSEVVLSELEDPSQSDATSFDGPPPAKRLRLVGSGSTHVSAVTDATQAASDPVLEELFGTLKVSHAVPQDHLKNFSSEEQVRTLRSTITQLQSEKSLQTRMAAANYLLNVAINTNIPNKLVFSLFELVQQSEIPDALLNILLRILWIISNDSLLVKSMLVKICVKLLSSNLNRVARIACLEILGDVADVSSDSAQMLKIFEEFAQSHDSRIRRAVVEMICNYDLRSGKISLAVYHRCLDLLKDENEKVRIGAIKIMSSYANKSPNVKITIGDKGDEYLRLEEHAFSQICELVNDIQVPVRVTSVSILRNFIGVDQKFLQQTLDKQLMSQLRTKRSSHQKNAELVRSGAYSSGRRWGDDAPLDNVDEQSLSLISSGACGALVHGLEDEFKEVRIAAVETLSHLSSNRSAFAKEALDFFIDMLNDEIELVRVKALESLATISHHVVLRKDQVVDTLSCLDDYSDIVREKVHYLLRKIQFEEMGCLKLTLQRLMRNLKKYPLDKTSIYGALKCLGSKHSNFVIPYMKELLCAHPFLDTTEPNVSDPFYIGIMILVLNAAHSTSNIIGLFPPFINQHHQFLKELHPEFIPDLDLNKSSLRFCYRRPESAIKFQDVNVIARKQYESVIASIKTSDGKITVSLLKNLLRDLEHLKNCEKTSGPANFLCASLKITISMMRVFEKLKSLTPTSQLTLSDESVFSDLKRCVSFSFYLEGIFNGLSTETVSNILENRCIASTLIVFFTLLKETNDLAGNEKVLLCKNFAENVRIFRTRITSSGLLQGQFSVDMLKPLLEIDSSKLTLICKFLHPLLLESAQVAVRTMVLGPSEFASGVSMAKAMINHPQSSDRVESFMAGLLLALRLDVTLSNIDDINRVRIVLTYPGGTDQVVCPSADKFRESNESDDDESYSSPSKSKKIPDPKAPRTLKLSTTCFISHSSWTEPADLLIGVYLAVPNLFDYTMSVTSSEKLVSISESVKIVIHPKPTAI